MKNISDIEELENFMHKSAIMAGGLALEYVGNHGKVLKKSGPMDVVTEGDTNVDEFLVNRIKQYYPDHGIISEEGDDHFPDRNFVWTVDPIDGTWMFHKGIPSWGVIMSLRINGETELGCIYDAVHRNYYLGVRGVGAYLNDKKILHSGHRELLASSGLTNDSLSSFRMELMNKLHEVLPSKDIWVSANGSTAISCARVAAGVLDWYACNGSGNIWDYDGPVLIMREAGCIVSNVKGEPWKWGDGSFIASNPFLHEELMQLFLTE